MSDFLHLRFGTGIVSTRGDTYSILQQLGRGGSAETYLALATSGRHQGHLFAVKVFRRLSRPEWRQSFLREMEFLQTCDHPSVMRVFDDGLYADEHPFMVAEYLPQTLAHRVRSGISIVEKLSYAMQLASAIDYLAKLDPVVVHRDVKPQNIFLKGGACVLGDFGLMKHQTEESMDREILKESLGPRMPRLYRTPDLVEYLKEGRGLSPLSDTFQLGLVFAELFTGRNPEKMSESFEAPVELEPLSFIPGYLGKPIKELIEMMLQAKPENRPKTGHILAQLRNYFLQAARSVSMLEGRVF